MHCVRCGASVGDGAAFCSSCGAPVVLPQTPGTGATAWPSPAAPAAYAGFWLRVVAWIVDGFILGAAFLLALVPLLPFFFHGMPPWSPGFGFPVGFVFLLWGNLFSVVAIWLYFALFESSSWQATPGKRVLGLYVTDLVGNRVSFGRATARYFGKILSSLIFFIGYLMAGFTAKKQALHDILAECLVVRRG
ncbi:MAG TPA: RDD family protein [Candidatus Acidoferrales bacterium]|nr:RDD family protein [Candidatus Acidoferrales bacterium]